MTAITTFEHTIDLKKTRIAIRLIFLFAGLAISSWAPMVPYAKARLHLDDAQLGLVLLAFGVGALFTMPLTGWLIKRFGSRKVIFISGLLIICNLPFLTIAPSAYHLSLILVIFGGACGAMNVSINSQAVIMEKKADFPLMSGFHCLFSVGGLFGATIISMMLEADFHLFYCALSMSILLVALLFSQTRHLFHSISDIRNVDQKSKFELPKGKIWLLGILCFISFLAEGSILEWSAEFLYSVHDFDPSLAGIGYAIFSIAMSFGRLTGDKIIARFGPLAVVQLGSLIAASGFIIAVNFSWAHIELLGFFLIGIGASNIVSILFSSAGRLPETSPSSALTFIITFGYTGILLGPAFIGFVAEVTSLSFALTGVAFLLIGVGLTCHKVLNPIQLQQQELAI